MTKIAYKLQIGERDIYFSQDLRREAIKRFFQNRHSFERCTLWELNYEDPEDENILLANWA